MFGILLLALLLAQSPDYVAEGTKALDENQPAAAEALFRKAIAADEKDVAAHFNLGFALLMQSKDAEAIAEMRRTLELEPGLHDAQINLGMLLIQNQQPGDAVTVLEEAVAGRPQDAKAAMLLAQALDATGDFPGAEKAYRSAIALDPKNAAAQLGAARTLIKEAHIDDAATFFKAAAEADARYKPALLELASEYEKASRFDDAIAIYKQFPGDAKITAHMGQLLIDVNKSAAAIPALESVVKASPTVANRLALADAYRAANRPVEMTQQLQLALAAEPNNFDLRMNYGKILRDQHLYTPAAEQFFAAARLQATDVRPWRELASVLIINNQFEQGLAALDKLRALGKELPGELYLRAISLDHLKQKQPAIDAYKQFLAVDGGKLADQEFLARQRIRIIEHSLHK